MVTLTILSGSFALALLLAWIYHLGMSQVTASALVGGGTLAALYLGWKTFKYQSQNATLDGIADRLAREVDQQWRKKAQDRAINKPYPLPVSWIVKTTLEEWDTLRRIASNTAGSSSQSSRGWTSTPDDLAGSNKELEEKLKLIPTGRLVVLGEPGAGKSILMVRLVLDMLASRFECDASDAPVPVLCPVASWDPGKATLDKWLEHMLPVDHPFLAAAAPPAWTERNRAGALLAEGRILPILDGLDEIPGEIRMSAIAGINDALQSGEHFVVTCRTREYERAVRTNEGAEVTLQGAAVVQLCPLKADDVSIYLRDSAPGDVAKDRWKPVTDSLSHHPSTVQVLDSPLMVTLARAVYNPRQGDSPAALPDPAELCSPTPVDVTAVKARLLGAFVPAVYRPKAGDRWRAAKAEKWLAFLAHHLEIEAGTSDLGWWELPKSAPALLTRIAASISDGLVCGRPFAGIYGIACAVASGVLIGVLGSPAGAFLTALAAGLGIWLAGAVTGLLPGSLMIWGAVGLAAGLSGGLMGGEAGGVVAGLATGLAFAVAVCLPEERLADTPTEMQSADTPNRRLRILAAIFVACFIAGLVAWLNLGALAGTLVAIAGAALVAACLYIGRFATPSSALVNSLTGGLSAGTVTAAVTGVPIGLVTGAAICLTMGVPMAGRTLENQGMSLVSGDSIAGMTPSANLALIRQTAFVRYWGIGLGIALIFGLAACSTVGIAVGVVAGIVEGFIAGCFCSRVKQKWPSYMMARAWLAKDGKVPWRLMAFLADARDREVLRQVGANYQFRHIELQKQLAETWWRFV